MSLKILFMGTPNFAVPILRTLQQSSHKILEVYTQPPKKKNRGQQISFSPIHEYSNEIKIPVRHPLILNTEEEFEHIKKLKPDISVVVAYGKLLPAKFLNLENTLFINVHASLLPKWRGAAPIHRAIMNCDNETGISIMKIAPKLDAGSVLLKSKIRIDKETNYESLSNQLSKLGAKLTLDALDLIENEKAIFVPQNEEGATYAKKIDKEESKINWTSDAKKIIAKINALHPNPGSWFKLKGARIKVIKAIEVEGNEVPGKIINKDFTIACAQNAVQILELKKEGKNKTTAIEFLKGNKVEVGSNILSNV
jgi:methionyl-tRNA formyltransferase